MWSLNVSNTENVLLKLYKLNIKMQSTSNVEIPFELLIFPAEAGSNYTTWQEKDNNTPTDGS